MFHGSYYAGPTGNYAYRGPVGLYAPVGPDYVNLYYWPWERSVYDGVRDLEAGLAWDIGKYKLTTCSDVCVHCSRSLAEIEVLAASIPSFQLF